MMLGIRRLCGDEGKEERQTEFNKRFFYEGAMQLSRTSRTNLEIHCGVAADCRQEETNRWLAGG